MLSILTKAQVFSLDLIIAVLVFGSAILIYYKNITNLSDQDEELLDDLLIDAKSISNSLVSQGYPYNWNKDNVVRIGITDNNRINETKLEQFSMIPYNEGRKLFGTAYNYYVFFRDKDNNILPFNESLEGIGKPGVNSTNIQTVENPKKLVKVTRLIVKESDIKKMVIYLWY
ncbi:hypothetical protein FP803_01810 [Candidatus Woesearchaeota archaeon]|nr:hypothetical protein [Candidatus Woesearchaeota archaeon]MBU3941670.1 hypothetical protein [Nanoarchaeota archaeon]